MSKGKDALLVCAVIGALSFAAPGAHALDLFGETLPQAQTNTCQSYAMMLALGAKGDANFRLNTFAELRSAEAKFRSIAQGIAGGPYGHEALQKAIDQYTGGKYTLKIETRNDIVQWMSRIKDLTTLRSSRDVVISQLTGTNFPVVLTSVTKFADSTYPGGHILTLLGMSGSGLNSNTELVAFNSAIKGGGATNRCEPGTQPGDLRYTAGVVSTKDYSLKDYPAFRILYLNKN